MKKTARAGKTARKTRIQQKPNKTAAERSCVACRKKFPKHEMIRLVLKDGRPFIDSDGRRGGRGVNICPQEQCFEQAVKKNLFSRAWKKPVSASLWDRVREEFRKEAAQKVFRKGSQTVILRVRDTRTKDTNREQNSQK
ncbi:MAG: YlxR family protein [Candidatus Dojkabacteria bacterium]|nr:YlxR family protein [Candidatus Dojkabacteria bacterium]